MASPMIRIETPPRTPLDEPRRGLLIAPEFPASSFWSYRHVMEMVGKKAAFPPLGLITFASLMPDSWSFELVDLNVDRVPDAELRERIAAVDAVFTSAMSVQKPSLVRLLEGPARGMDTPWVLGGPYPSSYRDKILEPETPSDEILHRGLDLLVWGEARQWVEAIDRRLRSPEGSRHSDSRPTLLIPEAIARAEPGDRRILNDRSIFEELDDTPPPRWDLIDVEAYRALMIQTTVGCRFRCEFCDIIRFNGGFTRPKTLASVRRELQALHDLGHRGGVFTVDDNFIGNPDAIESILRVMIEFQRERDYPFSFYTQASLDLGTPKLAHLLPLMKQAGFAEVFLGIENPDPEALRAMNKKQNVMVDIAGTVRAIQAQGIEVMAGFIFGGDRDTPETGEAIAAFADRVAIPTAMTGMLMPVPHTPLAERLAEEGRLRETEYSGNNTDDEVQFLPANMTMAEMKRGYHATLERMFGPGEMYRRASALLDRLKPHIFRGGGLRRSDLRAAAKSLWRQGVVREKRTRYLALLWKALRLDRARAREARRVAAEIDRRFREMGSQGRDALAQVEAEAISDLVEKAREALVRAEPGRRLEEIGEWATGLRERIEARSPTTEDLEALRRWTGEFFRRQRRVHRFPGAYLVKAFELAIKGFHYETVMRGMALEGRSEGRETPSAG